MATSCRKTGNSSGLKYRVRPPLTLDRNQDDIPDPIQTPVDFSRTLSETVGVPANAHTPTD